MMPSAAQSHGFVRATSSPHPRPAKCVNKTYHVTSPLNKVAVIYFYCICYLPRPHCNLSKHRVSRVCRAWCPLWCILPCLALLGRSAKLCHKRRDPKYQGALELQEPLRLRSLASKCFAISQNVPRFRRSHDLSKTRISLAFISTTRPP